MAPLALSRCIKLPFWLYQFAFSNGECSNWEQQKMTRQKIQSQDNDVNSALFSFIIGKNFRMAENTEIFPYIWHIWCIIWWTNDVLPKAAHQEQSICSKGQLRQDILQEGSHFNLASNFQKWFEHFIVRFVGDHDFWLQTGKTVRRPCFSWGLCPPLWRRRGGITLPYQQFPEERN